MSEITGLIEKVKIINLQPDDAIFVKVEDMARFSGADYVHLKEALRNAFPDNKVFVGTGFDIEIVRGGSAEAST